MNKNSPAMDFAALHGELCNTSRIERIRNMGKMPVAKFRAEIGNILEGGAVHFNGYRDTILAHAELMRDDTEDPAAETIAFMKAIRKKTAAMSACLSRLPERQFAASMESCLAGSDPAMEHFAVAIRSLAASANIDGAALKREALKFVAPMLPAEQRRYRTGVDGMTHYIAFARFDPDRQAAHEAGFSHVDYREYHHRTARKFIIMFIIILMATFIGFRIFFLGAYIRPLRRLLNGITQVREGNYDVVIPITMNDELGFMTHNFNEMAGTLEMSREALSDYSENLQKMVEERTIELEKARDTVWGEMELARKMRTILIPERPRIEGYEIAGHMAPAEMVGVDYYDIINTAGMDWVVIGDISGHGVPAGIIMMMVQTAIHTVLAGDPRIRPSDLLERVNTVIADNIQKLKEDKYMTITVIACLGSGSLYASGLHQDILVYRSARDAVETVKTCGIILGLKDVIEHVPGDREFALKKNDIMLLHADGITESWRKGTRRNHRNPRTDMFGQDRLADILCRVSTKTPGEIRDAILEELAGYELIDDVTMVIIKRK
ncbi:MAG TPA: SpoIIE family protein phosphatase [Spirochaetota bacterium]|nr:SpoIIE family protein phosphatase [Spirochaetota bacterium]HPC42219.1 SpoIIE family protein phosphatase [Spirochaetota bacterium]HQF08211.1 SpoIIE family protein phosphatase [Spirochaetota bacterium]HQH97174.1 SpoIIE family protein phosphatase [Spirochaetota bacterium]HQJ70084.1 SpoIIE family protein phosphatase [Spirochaetota bacterium]